MSLSFNKINKINTFNWYSKRIYKLEDGYDATNKLDSIICNLIPIIFFIPSVLLNLYLYIFIK